MAPLLYIGDVPTYCLTYTLTFPDDTAIISTYAKHIAASRQIQNHIPIQDQVTISARYFYFQIGNVRFTNYSWCRNSPKNSWQIIENPLRSLPHIDSPHKCEIKPNKLNSRLDLFSKIHRHKAIIEPIWFCEIQPRGSRDAEKILRMESSAGYSAIY